jgi:hypothetical protein
MRLDSIREASVILTDGAAAYYLSDQPSVPPCTGVSTLLNRVSLAASTPVHIGCLQQPSFDLPTFVRPSLAAGVLATIKDDTEVDLFSLSPFQALQSIIGQPATSSVATDGRTVYWTEFAEPMQAASIHKASVANGTPSVVLEGAQSPDALALDDQYLFFVDAITTDAGMKYAIQRVAR